MSMTIEEKRFIAEHHPNVEIESIRFESGVDFDDEGIPGNIYATKHAFDTLLDGGILDTAFVTINFRDNGSSTPTDFVAIKGFAQLLDYKADDLDYEFDPLFEGFPVRVKDGRFSITFPMMIKKIGDDDLEEHRYTFDTMLKDGACFQFNDILVMNSFVGQRFGTVLGELTEDGTVTDFEIENVKYVMLEDTEEDEESEEGSLDTSTGNPVADEDDDEYYHSRYIHTEADWTEL